MRATLGSRVELARNDGARFRGRRGEFNAALTRVFARSLEQWRRFSLIVPHSPPILADSRDTSRASFPSNLHDDRINRESSRRHSKAARTPYHRRVADDERERERDLQCDLSGKHRDIRRRKHRKVSPGHNDLTPRLSKMKILFRERRRVVRESEENHGDLARELRTVENF